MKSLRPVFLISGVITLISLGVAAYFMFWGPDRLQVSGRSLSELVETGELWGILAIPFVLIVSGLAVIPFIKIIFPSQIKNGVKARARVLKVWDTGVSINDNPQVGLLLEVKPLAGASFEIEAKTVVSRLNAALVQPGIMADVLYDPNRPKRLQVLTVYTGEPGQEDRSRDPVARMEQLNELRDKGLITENEYDRKKEEIIKNI